MVVDTTAHGRGTPSRLIALAAVLVPLLALGMIFAAVGGGQLARPWHVVPAGSRAPVVSPGTLFYTRHVDAHQLHVGDVVFYRRPEDPSQLLLHRVAELQPPGAIGTGVVAVMRSSDPAETPYYIQFGGEVERVSFTVPLAGQVAVAWQRFQSELLVAAAALALNGVWLARAWRRARVRSGAQRGGPALSAIVTGL